MISRPLRLDKLGRGLRKRENELIGSFIRELTSLIGIIRASKQILKYVRASAFRTPIVLTSGTHLFANVGESEVARQMSVLNMLVVIGEHTA